MPTAILVAVVLALPLLPPVLFSDFNLPKWGLLVVMGLLGFATTLFRRDLRSADPLPGRLAAAWFLLIGLGVFATTNAGLPWTSTGLEAVRTGALMLLFYVALVAGYDAALRRRVMIAAVTAPVLVLGVGILVERGLIPAAVIPHDASRGFTTTLGNTGLVGSFGAMGLAIAAFVAFAFHDASARRFALAGAIASGMLVIRSESRAAMLVTIIIVPAALVLLKMQRRDGGKGNGDVATSDSAEKSAPATSFVSRTALVVVSVAVGFGIFGMFETTPKDDSSTIADSALFEIQRRLDPISPSTQVRFELWHGAGRMARDHWLLGVGPGAYGHFAPQYRSAEEWRLSGPNTIVTHPHGEWTRLPAEYGLLGCLVWIVGIVLVVRRLGGLRALLHHDDARHPLVVGACLAGVVIVAIAFTWDALLQPALMTPAVVLLAFACRLDDAPPGRPSGAMTRIIVAGLVLIVAIAGFFTLAADQRGVERRDKLEAIKARVAASQAADHLDPDDILALGRVAQTVRGDVVDPWLSSELRIRLLVALDNLAEERLRLLPSVQAMTSDGEVSARGAALANAITKLPTGAELRDGLTQARTYVPSSITIHRLLARNDRREGRTVEAVEWLEKTLSDVNDAAPGVRSDLAQICFESKLLTRARGYLEDEVALYPTGPLADGRWESLTRITGAERLLTEAMDVVDRWEAALGADDRRRAVAGEVALHFGETPTTVGLFLSAPDTPADRADRGALLAQSLDGAGPDDRAQRLLAHIGRYPFDAPALSALATALGEIIPEKDPDDIDHLRGLRRRALARSRVLYAWEHKASGDEASLKRSLRLALRQVPEQGDAKLIDVLRLVDAGKDADARDAVRRWKKSDAANAERLDHELRTRPALVATGVVDLLD